MEESVKVKSHTPLRELQGDNKAVLKFRPFTKRILLKHTQDGITDSEDPPQEFNITIIRQKKRK